MTRDEAQAECSRLAAEHADRDTHQWRPREEPDGSWAVVKIGLPPLKDTLTAETRADERPATPADPRPDVPPHSAGF
ncbi:MAG: hypothetical protein ACR2OC_04470 [Solirubrobacterales bacterium]